MTILLMIVLVVGYALSTWSLKRQEHFDERRRRRPRRAAASWSDFWKEKRVTVADAVVLAVASGV